MCLPMSGVLMNRRGGFFSPLLYLQVIITFVQFIQYLVRVLRYVDNCYNELGRTLQI